MSWQPSASFETLKKRAAYLSQIRKFFEKRAILEVETPLLSHATVSDPHIQSIPAIYHTLGSTQKKTVYLQTSPEYAMKRLLAAGSGPIYQITKSFRQGEMGQLHNPEFTMLEWYRPGYDHHDLMNEMKDFLHEIFDIKVVEKKTIAEVYKDYTGLNPHKVTLEELCSYAKKNNLEAATSLITDVATGLDFIFSHYIEPHLGKDHPLFLYDFPASQAALAKIANGLASRFELYYQGIELANGFHELQNPHEQRQRFEQDLSKRIGNNAELTPLDERFLSALNHGLPDCAGVAVGVDRLIMILLQQSDIASVLSFSFERA